MTATTPSASETIESSQPSSWIGTVKQHLGCWLVEAGTRLRGTTQTRAAQPANTGGDRFASLASMIPGVVYQRAVSPDGDIRYTYISEGSREVFGVAPEEVMKDPEALFKTYSEDYKANFRQRLITASRAMTKWDVEASIVGADGQIRYTHAIAKPEKLSDGSVLWTGLILDATRIKQAEEELKAANRSVEAANQAKSMFLANMSHEIRTPMNGVLGMADLLLKTDLNSRQQRLLTTLKHSAQTLLGIINDVLDISRIEAGRFSLETEPFDLHQCLEDAIDLCAGAAFKKGLEINLIIDPTVPTIVKGDNGRLRQVLINLVGNAVKFTEMGAATVRATSTKPVEGSATIQLDVIDTGIGIDPVAKEKLFAPFAQADSSISRRFGGTGLGLAITRHLVTLMGGDVKLESEVGRGTKVSVSLPLEVLSYNHRDGGIEPLSDQRILLVDDRSLVRETIASKLRGTGAVFEFAKSGNEALLLLHKAQEDGRPFDAVVIDRLQPGAQNIEVCRRIQTDPRLPGLTVISIVSMNWKGESNGDRPFTTLPKPIRRADFIEALSKSARPVVADDTGHPGTASTEPADRPIDLGLTVLVAEDNPVNQEVAREYLTGFGCNVIIAQDGQEAIGASSDATIDIVLMDCQMPVLDGLSAVKHIRERERLSGAAPLPIIAVTANAYDSDRTAAFAAGMNDYLVKPFSEVGLLEMLEKWKASSPRATERVKMATRASINSIP